MTIGQDNPSAIPKKLLKGVPGNERIAAFSDGVFAICITLMVFQIKVPEIPANLASTELPKALLELMPSFEGFLISFVLVGIYWVGQHNIFMHIKRHDRVLMWLNNLFLLWIAFMPFPAALIAHYSDQETSIVFYATILILAGLTLDGIWWYATHHHRLVDEAVSKEMIRKVHRKVLLAPVLYLLAIPLSLLSIFAAKIIFGVVALSYIFPDPVDIYHHQAVHNLTKSN